MALYKRPRYEGTRKPRRIRAAGRRDVRSLEANPM